MTVWQGVIEKSTGDLIRAGYLDFSIQSIFDAGTEEVRTDVPFPAFVKGPHQFNGIIDIGDPDFDTFHRWNGAVWVTVANNIGDLSINAFNSIKDNNFVNLTHTTGKLTKVEYFSDEARTDKIFTKDLTYSGDQLTVATLTREVDSQTFTQTLTYTGDAVTKVDYT